MIKDWIVGTYAQDIVRLATEHTPETGDGRIYVVRNIHGYYLRDVWSDKSTEWTNKKKLAKKFYDGQEAWGAARRSIYPTEILVIKKAEK